MVKVISFVIAIITAFNTFVTGIFSKPIEEEPTTEIVQTETDLAIESFRNSLYDEDGTYICTDIKNNMFTDRDQTYVDTMAGVFTVEVTSKMILSALSSLIPKDKIEAYIKEEFFGDTTAKYKNFFNTAEGVLYIMERLDKIDKEFRELTNTINKGNLEEELVARNTLVDNLSSKTTTVFDTFVTYSSRLDEESVRTQIKNKIYEWATANTTGTENQYATINLIRNITNRTTGKTLPDLYDEYATYIYNWEHNSYEYREAARIIDSTVLMKAYILMQNYYIFKMEDAVNSGNDVDAYELGLALDQLNEYTNKYIEVMNKRPVVKTSTTKCYITGLESLVVNKKIAHFDYVRYAYEYRDTFVYEKNETIQSLMNNMYTRPYAYYDSALTKKMEYTGDFKYVSLDDYKKLMAFYNTKGKTLINGLLEDGFEGINDATCFSYASDYSDINFSDEGFWSFTGTGLTRNFKVAWKSMSSNEDYIDIKCIDYENNIKWHGVVVNINININTHSGKGIGNWNASNNIAYNRASWDHAALVLA